MYGYGSSTGIDRYEAESIAERAASSAARDAVNDERYERERQVEDIRYDLRTIRESVETARSTMYELVNELHAEIQDLREKLATYDKD